MCFRDLDTHHLSRCRHERLGNVVNQYATIDIRRLVAALRTDRQRDEVASRFAPLAPASDEQVARAELELGLAFPEDFAYLQTTLGGGVVGLTWTYSVNPEGENPIQEINGSELQPRTDFLAFSDNGAGDYYGFKIAHGTAVPGVWVLDHETGELSKTADTFTQWLAATSGIADQEKFGRRSPTSVE